MVAYGLRSYPGADYPAIRLLLLWLHVVTGVITLQWALLSMDPPLQVPLAMVAAVGR